jgi:hypothetical protein
VSGPVFTTLPAASISKSSAASAAAMRNRKLNLTSTAAIVRYAIRNKLVDP